MLGARAAWQEEETVTRFTSIARVQEAFETCEAIVKLLYAWRPRKAGLVSRTVFSALCFLPVLGNVAQRSCPGAAKL